MSLDEERRVPTRSAVEPEEWIVAIATKRDKTAFIALFGAFAPKLKRYHIGRGASIATAEDVAQETLLAVWRKADQFEPHATTAAAWIFTISRYVSIDRYRRERRRPDVRSDIPENPATPEEVLRAVQDKSRLREALSALPSDQAEVLRQSFFEDHSHAEIATSLGVPLGTVKSRIRLAANRLRSSLESRA